MPLWFNPDTDDEREVEHLPAPWMRAVRQMHCDQLVPKLEHIPGEKGPEVLRNLIGVAARGLFVTTPCGYDHQPEEAQGNPYQVHVSGWDPAEFVANDFQVIINGPENRHEWRPREQAFRRPQIVAWRGQELPTVEELLKKL